MLINHQSLTYNVLSTLLPKTKVEEITNEIVKEVELFIGNETSPPSATFIGLNWSLKSNFWIYGNALSQTKQEVYFNWQVHQLFSQNGVSKQIISDIGNEALYYVDEFDTNHLLVLKGNIIFTVSLKIKTINILQKSRFLAIFILQNLIEHTTVR
jgi:hypothetical protein